MSSGPVFWKTHREIRNSRSSCEAEVKTTDEATKTIQGFRNILDELHLINLRKATTIYNDNQGAVDWCNACSTKGMRHYNIRENAVREAVNEFFEVKVCHIGGKQNPADIFTKEFKDAKTFLDLRSLLIVRSSGHHVLNNGDLSRMDGGC
jgi:hypothetical protein